MDNIPKFTVEEIRDGCADLWGNVECLTCSRLLGYIKDLLDSRASVAAPPPDSANEAANKIADYFNAPPSVIPAIEQIIKRC